MGSVTTLITCTWSQFVLLHLEKNVATTLKRNARMYLRSTAIRYHTRSSTWNATRAMEVIHTAQIPLMAILTKQLKAMATKFRTRVQVTLMIEMDINLSELLVKMERLQSLVQI